MASTDTSSPPRVDFREDQPLRAADLSAEQAYLIALRRVHNAAEHGWGIAHGLTLKPDDSGGVVLAPGLAVDGYGRELVVAAPITLTKAGLAQGSSAAVDVWLVYLRVPADAAGRECGPGRPHDRWREDVFVRLVAADLARAVQPVVPDRGFLVTIPPPDDSRTEWPVYLGRVSWMKPTEDAPEKVLVVDGRERTDAGLLGEQVLHPLGDARVQVGAERAGDRRRFAVSFADAAGNWTDRLAIDHDGNATITGHVFSEGEPARPQHPSHPPRVVLCPLKKPADPMNPTFGGMEFRPLPAPPKVAKPWQVYHAVVTDGAAPAHELRAEIAHPGNQDDPANYRFTVWGWPYLVQGIPQRAGAAVDVAGVVGMLPGATAPAGAAGAAPDGAAAPAAPAVQPPTFQPLLTVKADGTVELTGDLFIKEGKLVRGPIPADPNDPRFRDELAKQWARGLAQGFNTLSPSGLKVTFALTDPTPLANVIHYTITVQSTAAVALDPVQVNQHITYPGRASDQPDGGRIPSFRLEAGQTRQFPQTCTYQHVPGQDKITVSLMAIGVAATGALMYDTPNAQDFPAAGGGPS